MQSRSYAWAAMFLALSLSSGRQLYAAVITEYPAGASDLREITSGPDGNLWFTSYGSNKIVKLTMGGVPTQYSVPTANSAPIGITVGPDGKLWFTESNGRKIGKITTAGVFTEYPPATASSLDGITSGPDGNLWFTDSSGGTGGRVGKVTTTGTFTLYNVPTVNAGPRKIVAGPDGKLWFTEATAKKIGKVTTAGAFTEYSIPSPLGSPIGIAKGADGNLWFAESGADRVGRVTTSGAFTQYSTTNWTWGVAPGLDGDMWYSGGGSLLRINPSGVSTTYPNAYAYGGLTLGSDGNLWFLRDSAVDRLSAFCPSTPADTCSEAAKGSLSVGVRGQKLAWKWSRGVNAVTQSEFGDPLAGSTIYTFCLYDMRGGVPGLKMDISVTAGGTCGTSNCWKPIGDKGWSYKNRDSNSDGVVKLNLKGGDAGKPQIQMQAKGWSLNLPTPYLAGSQLFASSSGLIVQLHRNDTGDCWSSTLSTTRKNDAENYKASAP